MLDKQRIRIMCYVFQSSNHCKCGHIIAVDGTWKSGLRYYVKSNWNSLYNYDVYVFNEKVLNYFINAINLEIT